ncbi:3D domain-containing protein [uncultured Massilia sp.]|uniref:3D domain-containing protein n=1 Tax=uncultured Massilia sp. TaxID=169973 RepID=UPI0025E86D0D|nr:3D domain-containing protein [uncultured Massilia sp.]
MSEVIVGQANTNLTPGSVAAVKIDDYICTLGLEENEFGDTLPIIPTTARTERNKILYHLRIKATLTRQTDGSPVPSYKFSIRSNRASDRIESKGQTNAQGEVTFTLVTREPGELELTTPTVGISLLPFSIKLQQAWYESPFLITGYNVCDESDFSGQLVEGKGLDEKHKDDFLYGAAGVAMQGTGKTTQGRYVRLNNKPGGWQTNKKGSPERLANPSAAEFAYASGVHGKYDDLKENYSIAVDKAVIPKKAKVEIDGLGERVADDSGGAIDLYHIDNFLGSGKAVVKTWLKGGINGTKRRVKYLGNSK